MTNTLTTLAAALANRLPEGAALAWLSLLPIEVTFEAIEQNRAAEARAIAAARVDLQLQEIREAVDAMEQEARP